MKVLKAAHGLESAPDVEESVARILRDLRVGGDAVLRELTLRFDRVDRASPRLSPREIDDARGAPADEARHALAGAYERIAAFARAQRDALQAVDIELGQGIRVGHRFLPCLLYTSPSPRD